MILRLVVYLLLAKDVFRGWSHIDQVLHENLQTNKFILMQNLVS